MMFIQPWQFEGISASEFRRRFQVCRTKEWQLRKDNILRVGTHYMRTGLSSRSAILYNPVTCEYALKLMTQG